MPHFTLCLKPETAKRIKEINTILGGSVGSFASAHVEDLAQLDLPQLVEVRQQIRTLAENAKAQRTQTAGKGLVGQ